MDGDDTETVTDDIINATAIQDKSLNSGSAAVDYSPDDEDLDEAASAAITAAEATRDTLADGLVARLLRPCVDRLDASVQCTRLSQLDLKLQLDSLAAELKRLSLAQHDYMFAATSLLSPQSPTTADKAASPSETTTYKTTTDTCALLDGYARRLCGARTKIAIVGNILESTQERLRALSHRIGREHNNRRSLLEPQAVVTSVAVEELELEIDIKEEDEIQEVDDGKEENQKKHNEDDTNLDEGGKEEQQQPMENATMVASSSSSASEFPELS